MYITSLLVNIFVYLREKNEKGNKMSIDELIKKLENYKKTLGGDANVRIGTDKRMGSEINNIFNNSCIDYKGIIIYPENN